MVPKVFILIIVIWQIEFSQASRGTELEKKIFKNYSSNVRPTSKKNEKTSIQVTLFVQHIEKVDDKRQTIKMHGAIHTHWKDERLQWKPSEFNNTDTIFVQFWKVWAPDIRVLNSVEGNRQSFSETRHDVLVFNTGYVSFTQDFSFHISCPLSHKRYPNDVQKCPIVLASLMYDFSLVDWNYGWEENQRASVDQRLDWRKVKRHLSGWQLLNVTARKAYLTRGGVQYSLEANTSVWAWPMVLVQVELIRHKPYFYLLEAIPMLAMAMLTMVSFWVDAPLMTLAILMFTVIAQGFFSWDLFQEMPPATDGMPKLAVAYAFNFGMTCMAFLLHIVLQYLDQPTNNSTFIPPFISLFVTKVHKNPFFGGPGIRLFPSPASEIDLAQLNEEGPSSGIKVHQHVHRMHRVALVARRVLFWAYVITYSIFVVVIAV